MKSVLFGWMVGLGLLASHIGCCTIRMAGDGCATGSCGGGLGCGAMGCGAMGCGGSGACGTLRSRIADRIRGTNCGSGCGEIYWDEHINERPVCDPCGCDGEFDCGGSGNCPTVLGRLRNLWGYRYIPSNCGECTSCETTPSRCSSGSCSTCAGNTHSEYGTEFHAASQTRTIAPSRTMATQPETETTTERSPRPAATPRPQRAPSIAPTPVPDANAMYQNEAAAERLTIGSGVTPTHKTTIARPVSANTKQSIQAKPRLVTNPR